MGGLNLEGLIRGGPYFRNFTVSFLDNIGNISASKQEGSWERRSRKTQGEPEHSVLRRSLFVSQGGSGEGKMRARGTTGSSPALIAISEFTQQVGWKKKTCDKSDKSDRAITGVFCRDIH